MKSSSLFTALAAASVVVAPMCAVVVQAGGGFLRSSSSVGSAVTLNSVINDSINNNGGGGVWEDKPDPPRQSYLHFTLGGVNTSEWTSVDLTVFDNSVREAYDAIHGERDDFFWRGLKVKKIKRRKNNGDSDSAVVADADGADEHDLSQKKMPKKSGRFFDVYTLIDYSCYLCRKDRLADNNANDNAGLLLEEKPTGMDDLPGFADKVCTYLTKYGDASFDDVRDCAIDVLYAEDIAKILLEDDVETSNEDNIITAAAHLVTIG